MAVLDEYSFASSSVPVHLLRGALGLAVVIGAIALIPVIGPVSLLGTLFALVAWRGCPTCWAIGLGATISRGRLERACTGDGCTLVGAER